MPLLAPRPAEFSRHASLGTPQRRGHIPVDREQTRSSLLRRVRDLADEASWSRFVAQYEPVLLAYVRRRGLHEHDAHDVVQEVFLRLHRAMPTFQLDRARGRFRTWLWQVTRSALADWSRAQRRQAQAEQGWRAQQDAEPSVALSSTATTVAENRRVLAQALRQVQARSQPRTWACFEQRILRGRPSAAVAAELGLSPTAVNVNASRTLARLRKCCDRVRDQLASAPDFLPCGA